MTVFVAVDGSSLNEGLKRNSHLDNSRGRLLIDHEHLRTFLEGDLKKEEKAVSKYYISNPVMSEADIAVLEGWQKEGVSRLHGTIVPFPHDQNFRKGNWLIREDKTGNHFTVFYRDIEYCSTTDVAGNGFRGFRLGEKVTFILGVGDRGTAVAQKVRSNSFYQLARQMFFKRVKEAGFEIVSTRQEMGVKKSKSVDIQITIDALQLLEPHNDLVLVSDDIVFLPLIEALQKKDINVTVAAFADRRPDGRSYLPKEIESVAYDVIKLEEHLDEFILDPNESDDYDDDYDDDEGYSDKDKSPMPEAIKS